MGDVGSHTSAIRVALGGNPNSGKTTIFNNITGARQHVGNYAGVTVEKKVGHTSYAGHELEMIDLPGTYSLTARSIDELAARDVLIHEHPEVIVNVIDASNMERNLYLTAQLMELEKPMLLVLNMVDVAEELGMRFNYDKLAQLTGTRVVETIGRTNQGTDKIFQGIIDTSTTPIIPNGKINYGEKVEPALAVLEELVKGLSDSAYPTRWLAVKLLEQDSDVIEKVQVMTGGPEIVEKAVELRKDLEKEMDLDILFQEYRHRFAVELYSAVLETEPVQGETRSDKIDKILTNRVLGLPIFAAIMWALFNIVFTLGEYPQGWVEEAVTLFSDFVGAHMEDGLLKSLVIDGAIGGVGAVLSFVPLIVILFVGISFLEDSGYMARAAFVMDRIMRAFGLQGKSFIPLLLGFGCTVPAVMGARILDNPKDRMVTIMVAPFMSCSARLPVYTLLIGAFFPAEYGGTILFGVYTLGIVVAVLVAKIARKFVFTGETEPFVMEMPPYHLPTFKSVMLHMWERTALYIKKAGTFILAASVLIWFLVSFPQEVEYSKDFDAAIAQVEQTYDAQKEEAFAKFNVATDEQKEQVEGLVAQMEEIAAAQEEEEAEEETEEASAEEAKATETAAVEAEAPEYFGDLKANHSALFPAAWAVYQNEQERGEKVHELEFEQSSEKIQQSYAARFGKAIEPIMEPLGYNWRVNVAIVGAIAAKEVMVSTLGTIYSVEADEEDDKSLQELLAADPTFTPAIGLSLMVFSLLYLPCLAAMAVIKRETGSWLWFGVVFVYTNVLAWVGAYITLHVARFFGIS